MVVHSRDDFAATLRRAEEAITGRGLTLFTRVDHAANAERARLTLPRTAVFIFGAPEVGTQLMRRQRTVAIDLPQKLLVWEEEGRVLVAYNEPRFLAERHRLGDAEDLDEIAEVLGAIAAEAAGRR